MKSFLRIFLFELEYRSRRWDTYIYFIAFFILCFYSIHSSGIFVNYGGSGQRVYANSSITIAYFISRMSIWLIAISAALMSVPVIRDKETRSFYYYYTLPITKFGYLGGRFLGSLFVLLLISLAVPLGILTGYLMPGHDPSTLQPLRLVYFIRPYLLLIVFNLVFSGFIFFSMVVLTKNVLGGYMTAVLLIAFNMISTRWYNPMDMGAYVFLDPYGENAFFTSIRGWSIVQRNTGLIPFSGWILYNRLAWLGLGLLLFLGAYGGFSFKSWLVERRSSRLKQSDDGMPVSLAIPPATRDFSLSANLLHLLQQGRLELAYHLKTVFFLVMICAAGFILFYDAFALPAPTVSELLSIKDGYFSLFALVILIFFAGEAVNRERELKLSHITDTLPVPDWVYTGSRLLSIVGIAFLLCVVVFTAMTVTPLYKGYHHIRWDVFLIESFGILFPYYALLAVLAFSIQVMVRNKFVGHGLMILFFVLNIVAKSLGIEHNLLFYAAAPKPVNGPLSSWAGYSIDYSEMNGYGPFAAGRFWFTLYWALFALVLLVLVNLFWKRGIELNFSERWRLMRSRWSRPSRIGILVAGLLWLTCGGFIYYNTNVLNEYIPQTSDVIFRRMAAYEKKYKQYEKYAQPWITRLGLDADLYASQRRAEMKLDFRLENRGSSPIDTIFLTLPPQVKLEQEGDGLRPTITDDELHFYAFRLPRVLMPGEKTEFLVRTSIRFKGFLNETKEDVARFSDHYMSLTQMDLPVLGYEPMMEINNPAMRKKLGLADREIARPASFTGGQKDSLAHINEDSVQRSHNAWSRNSDWVYLDMKISTDTAFTAIAPGRLIETRTTGARKFFHYSTGEQRLSYGFKLYAGEFSRFSEPWIAPDGHDSVQMELYCYAGHTRNKDSLFRISTDYLRYLYSAGGQLPIPVLRYVEMPYGLGNIYESTMQEQFEGRGQNPNFMDYTCSNIILRDYFKNALAPAAAPGSMIFGALDEYFIQAGLVDKYPSYTFPQSFFTSTFQYLTSRVEEKNRERPIRNCYFVPYMSNKIQTAVGSLQYLMGAEKLRTSLLSFRKEHAFSGPPYLVSAQLLDYLRTQLPDSARRRFDETFDQIIFYRNRITAVQCKKEGPHYLIDVELEKHKISDDGQGNESPVKEEEYIDLGVFTAAIAPDSQLPDLIQSVRVKDGVNHIRLYSDKPPVKVILDPHYVLMNLLLLNGKNEQWKKVKVME